MTDPKPHIYVQEDEDVRDVLRRWSALSNIQRRALLGIANEVQMSSELVESSVSSLSDHFLKLASLAQTQSRRISDFADETTRIEFEGRHLSLSEVFSSLEEDLKDVATNKVPTHFNLKDRLKNLMSTLVIQSQNMEEALKASALDSKVLSDYIAEIVTKMQFQDRTSQRLALICSSLKVVGETLKEMEASSADIIGNKQNSDENIQWIEEMISDMNLGEMRERFVKHLLFDETDVLYDDVIENEKTVDHAEASDDIELF